MDKKPKLLFFNDDKLLATMYEKKFIQTGFEVKIIGKYPENIVEIAVQEKPDIIACDVAMPGMDGFEAVGLLKQDEKTKNIPVVFFTNMGEKENIDKGMALGAAGYLVMAKTPPEKASQIFKDFLIKSGKFQDSDFS